MSNTLRRLRTFGLYLLPASLLVTAGTLLMGLLYYPVPSAIDKSQIATEDSNFWRAHAEDMFVILLADAIRQLREEQNGRRQMQMYQYDVPSANRRPFSRVIPMRIENGAPSKRPVLIRL